MKKIIINFILLIVSRLPVISFTNDKRYGENRVTSGASAHSQLKEWRLSLIQLMLGAYKLYLITISRTYDTSTNKASYHPCLYKIISLNSIFDESSYIQQISDNYYNRLTSTTTAISEDRMQIEKESLSNHIESQNKRIEKSDNKINIYTSLVLTLLPILLGISFDSILSLFKINIVYKIILIVSAYFIMNIVLYLFQYIKVGGFNTSSFNALKVEPDSTVRARQVTQYYFDFQHIKRKADLFVSYIKNIQIWMWWSLIIFISTLFYHQAYSNISSSKANSNKTSNSIAYNLDLSALNDPYSNSSIQLTDIRKCIQTHNADKIIVLFNAQSDITIIENELQVFDSSFEIQYVNDDQLEVDCSKVLIYNGRTP